MRIFLLGGKPEVVGRAAEHARQQLGQEVVGVCDGYAGMRASGLLAHITQSQPDILLVALGNPIQGQWILQHRDALDVPLVMGVAPYSIFGPAINRVRRASYKACAWNGFRYNEADIPALVGVSS